MDVKDILGFQQKNSQPHNQSQRKPDDISQEVYALTGGLAPLIPSVDLSLLNKRPQSEKKEHMEILLRVSSMIVKNCIPMHILTPHPNGLHEVFLLLPELTSDRSRNIE
ncbi:hypothetical protein TSUD_38810 [Trifolium subterraneum]|uniref:Uncharacterized protein n=1 Tax=Trifolium subterraneum TaxID=3900 RepID=A0A2Z6N2U8_TRISU|nr:hypothetical protein TSUD_38810 [Trifolium subterraneum]